MKRAVRNSIGMTLGTITLSAMLTGPASADVATPAPNASSVRAQQHCRVIIDKVKPGQRFSRVQSRKCSTDLAALGVNPGTLIMTWYEHRDYKGDSTYVEGAAGPCDAAGYRIDDTGGFYPKWLDIISSFKVWNDCNLVHAFSEKDFGGENIWYSGNRAYVGDIMNDRIRSLTIHAF